MSKKDGRAARDWTRAGGERTAMKRTDATRPASRKIAEERRSVDASISCGGVGSRAGVDCRASWSSTRGKTSK